MKKVIDVIMYVLGLTFNAALLIIAFSLIYNYSIKSFVAGKDFASELTADKGSKQVEIVLSKTSTIDEVADILHEKEVITSPLVFKLENLLKNTDDNFKAGTYTVDTAMDSNELVKALRHDTSIAQDIKITIKEGYTTKDIGMLLESKELVTCDEFLKACNEIELDYKFLQDVPTRENRLEGYLFPDTYMIAPGTSADKIIYKLLNRFEEIYKWEYQQRAKELGLTTDQVITVASIIEKEISRAEERALASAVIYNRLKKNEALGMCSTILYALDKRKDRLLDEDLKVESPYNTYINPGLPVGPIANAGEACIIAALYPSADDYLYFVVKDEETGEHFFTKSYDEFLNAKAEYKQKF